MSKNSSFQNIPNNFVYKTLFKAYQYLSAITDPVTWILHWESETILDVGCGQGYPMQLIKMVREVKATGIDLFDDYIKEAKNLGIYEKVIRGDVTKLKIKPNSYDAVICLQVIEHVSKKNGLKMIEKMEEIAKKQVIIATPVDYFEHPDMDDNKLQRHLSAWSDDDFKKRGYIVKHQGLSLFFGNDGLVHKNIPSIIKAAIFILDKLLMPVYMVVPGFADYWIIAYKNKD